MAEGSLASGFRKASARIPSMTGLSRSQRLDAPGVRLASHLQRDARKQQWYRHLRGAIIAGSRPL